MVECQAVVDATNGCNVRAALCGHCDVIQSRDVISHVTIRLSIDDFLYVVNRNHISLSLRLVVFRYLVGVKNYEVITEVITMTSSVT